ncbi:MAG: glycosyltransferase [Vicinamibacterales bacterium]
MIYYFLPEGGIYGGVKLGCQFVDLLTSLDVPATVVLPGGRAPQWFTGGFAVMDEGTALARLGPDDWAVYSWPPHYERLRTHPARLACHCMGTDPALDPGLSDPAVTVLTCWAQASRYVSATIGRRPVDVGLAISEAFVFDGGVKWDNQVAYMPRRGAQTAAACRRAAPSLAFVAIDRQPEAGVARALKASGLFLATAEGEWFGLPALEAMAAGCVVLSVPVLGGMEYLRDGDTCLVTTPADMPERLRWVTQPAQATLRDRLRTRGVAEACRYLPPPHRRRLEAALAADLRAWRP